MTRHLPTVLLVLLALNTGWFFVYSGYQGWRGLMAEDPAEVSRVFMAGTPFANAMIALHMLAGAVVTIGAPVQALRPYRRRWPALHRRTGYLLVGLAVLTGFGGLVYIGVNGTIGGGWMSVWFAIYGVALGLCAVQTLRFGHAGEMQRHFDWATRFVVLAVGSWIYRMHYALWFWATDGAGSTDALTGPFDRVQVVAFFVPYLLLAELALLWRRRRLPG
jgi:hypothetical protein